MEPLHDLKGHLSNMIDEIRVYMDGEAKQKVESICSTVLNKNTLHGSDYRKAAILILLLLHNLQPTSALTTLLLTVVEISEILYSDPEKRSPQNVLRLHNLAFAHAKLGFELFSTPKTMSRRKMFGPFSYHTFPPAQSHYSTSPSE